MKNLVLTLLFLMSCAPWCRADDELKEYDRMIVSFRDGSNKEIPIKAGSAIKGYVRTEEGTPVKYICILGDGCEYEYRRSDILSFRFLASEMTGLTPVFDWEQEKDHLLVFENDQLTVHRKLCGETLRIYDLSGRLLLTRPVPPQGVIALSELRPGIYVVSVNNYSIQIVKS